MVLKPAWDGHIFSGIGNNGFVALSHTQTSAHKNKNKKSDLFYVHPIQTPTPTDYRGPASYSDGVDEMPMQTRRIAIVQTKTRPTNIENDELRDANTGPPSCRQSSRLQRKLELEQDIEKLRKKLRYEENVHRALERAFTRPRGALPRLPSYLSPKTLELLAEVAVLEEEVVRLEEHIVKLRQGLYQEAAYMSSSKKQVDPIENSEQSKAKKPELLRSPSWGPRSVEENQQAKKDFLVGSMFSSINESSSNVASQTGSVNRKKASSGYGSEPKVTHFVVQVENSKQPLYKAYIEQETVSIKGLQKSSTPSQAGHGKENQQHANPRIVVSSSYVSRLRTATQKQHTMDSKALKTNAPKAQTEHNTITCRLQPECMPSLSALQDGEKMDPNRLSEEMLKCLSSIFLKLTRHSSGSEYDASSVASWSTLSTLSSRRFGCRNTLSCKLPLDSSEETAFKDPYGVCVDSELRDVGPYKYIHEVAANSVDWSRKQHSSPLLKRLKALVDRLSSVDLRILTHQQKLAFWINMYNVCMMNAFLEHGIPGNPQMVVALMHKAVINVGGHLLNALTIEHFILRLPYHSKDAYPKGGKKDREATMRSIYGLEWPEPLVTFALSCGSWSSPSVRVYTAAEVENELQTAKKEYLQAAIGITSKKQLLLPKLLDWYLRDFAKDAESLLDWICLELPSSLRNAVMECMERGRKELASQVIKVMSYEFDFRYLFAT